MYGVRYFLEDISVFNFPVRVWKKIIKEAFRTLFAGAFVPVFLLDTTGERNKMTTFVITCEE